VKVLVAMSGGVDSSVAAARLVEAGHDVTGVTMKLWGGDSDTGCCSVADVDDARRVARQLDVDHLVFGFGDEFREHVVEPYVEAHRRGLTPNPCIECNRHLKFDRLTRRAAALGFDAVATGHHARIVERPDGSLRLARGADPAKDQSYVLYMLDASCLADLTFPVGELTKAQVRSEAARLGLRTATKPDSQDVCFITNEAGRRAFLGDHIPLHAGVVVDGAGRALGAVDAVELVTPGQRKGLGLAGLPAPRYATSVDVGNRRVVVGPAADLLVEAVTLRDAIWADGRPPTPNDATLSVQCRAHGPATPARVVDGTVHFDTPQPLVAAGQSVVVYRHDEVVGGGISADR
jgi:tRNA-specific 2-thiouridylase